MWAPRSCPQAQQPLNESATVQAAQQLMSECSANTWCFVATWTSTGTGREAASCFMAEFLPTPLLHHSRNYPAASHFCSGRFPKPELHWHCFGGSNAVNGTGNCQSCEKLWQVLVTEVSTKTGCCQPETTVPFAVTSVAPPKLLCVD